MNQITVVMPVKNEANHLRRGIPLAAKLGFVLVVDSGSTDKTQRIARERGAEVLDFKWDGKFPKKRNWTLRNYDFKTEWVLFLDADEFINDEFVAEVQRTIAKADKVGFWLNFENHFMGKKLRGGDPFRKLALFKIGAGEYEQIDEDHWSHLDMEVHEHPVLKGKVGEIKTFIEHNDFRGLKHYIDKHNEYSSWEAMRYVQLIDKQKRDASWNRLTDRQKKKYQSLEKWWFAPVYFIASYFLKKGFLDGTVGFHFALMKAIYFYQIRLKIKEQLHSEAQPEMSATKRKIEF